MKRTKLTTPPRIKLAGFTVALTQAEFDWFVFRAASVCFPRLNKHKGEDIMNTNTRRMVLRLARFLHAVDAAEQRAGEAYAMDAQFDGGEFSGPATQRALERERDRIAQRFGFTSAYIAERCAAGFRLPTHPPQHVIFGHPLPLPR